MVAFILRGAISGASIKPPFFVCPFQPTLHATFSRIWRILFQVPSIGNELLNWEGKGMNVRSFVAAVAKSNRDGTNVLILTPRQLTHPLTN